MKTINLVFVMALLSVQSFAQTSSRYHNMLKTMYKNTVEFISPADLKAKLSGANAITVLDTRKQKEYDASHIAGARFVDYDSFQVNKVKDIPKSDTIVIYCSVGYRSERVGEKLRKAGYEHVYNLYGGLFEWVNLGYEVVDNNKARTSKIHAYDKEWGKWLSKGDKVYE